ncbi:MAG: DUF58 domain-containing protein [Hydrogenophilales bacterium]|jgi:uncharacterized protein (DUF58 family)|nr:DUF58 domain-containing protein [Hydrogenophilales bacterium]MBP8902569.1 DUF58 domain-containing protein [Thiobacillaceae bacterium]
MSTRALPYLPWRKPKLESGPLGLTARRLYILPTRSGLVFGLLLLGLLVGAINYGVSLAYLFTFWFAGLAVVGMLHTQRNLSGLVLRPGAPAPVFAGETAAFPLRVDNPGAVTRRRIAIRHPEGRCELRDIPAAGSARIDLLLPQSQRGWHVPGRFSLYSEYPLGLFRCWSVMELDWGVLVYPAPAADALPFPEADANDGDGATPRGEGADFTGLRGYQPGDPPRRIAWKAVARGGRELVTKQFAGGAERNLWLDWRRTPERDPEARLSRLTRWALDAHAAGLAFGLRLPGGELPPRAGEAHLRACLEALAREARA